ncbi:MAG TPA: hypothetical protein VHB79_05380 [Polyangiaceae bacterium]|nr:hypothetical protein [Polyangiaceae bacterium]
MTPKALIPVVALVLGIAAACSDGDKHKVVREEAAGAGGEDSGPLGGAPSAGQAPTPGGEPGTERGGADGGQAGAAGTDGTNGGVGGSAGEANPSQAGATNGGEGPLVVSSYGCFALSGDGSEMQVNGEPGVVVTSSPYGPGCDGSQWVSDNANAYAPMQVPSTLRFRRSFVLAQAVADGSVSISFKADDAVSFVLNGQTIGKCEPTADNLGLCQQGCTQVPLSAGVLLDQQANVLDIELTNLQSADAGNGHFGWTAVSYALCVAPP